MEACVPRLMESEALLRHPQQMQYLGVTGKGRQRQTQAAAGVLAEQTPAQAQGLHLPQALQQRPDPQQPRDPHQHPRLGANYLCCGHETRSQSQMRQRRQQRLLLHWQSCQAGYRVAPQLQRLPTAGPCLPQRQNWIRICYHRHRAPHAHAHAASLSAQGATRHACGPLRRAELTMRWLQLHQLPLPPLPLHPLLQERHRQTSAAASAKCRR